MCGLFRARWHSLVSREVSSFSGPSIQTDVPASCFWHTTHCHFKFDNSRAPWLSHSAVDQPVLSQRFQRDLQRVQLEFRTTKQAVRGGEVEEGFFFRVNRGRYWWKRGGHGFGVRKCRRRDECECLERRWSPPIQSPKGGVAPNGVDAWEDQGIDVHVSIERPLIADSYSFGKKAKNIGDDGRPRKKGPMSGGKKGVKFPTSRGDAFSSRGLSMALPRDSGLPS